MIKIYSILKYASACFIGSEMQKYMNNNVWNSLVKENERTNALVDIDNTLNNSLSQTFKSPIHSQIHNESHTFILDSIEYPNGICLLMFNMENINSIHHINDGNISLKRHNTETLWYKEGTKVATITYYNGSKDDSSVQYDLVVPFSCSFIEWNDKYLDQILSNNHKLLDHSNIKLKRAYIMIVSRSKQKRSRH